MITMKKRMLLIIPILVMLLTIQVSAQMTSTCDYIESNPDKFWIDEAYWNGTGWEAPLWYQYWSNATSGPYHLVTPPLENQTQSFKFTISINIPGNIWVGIYGFCFDSRNYYNGTLIDHESWLGTNGVVIASTGPYIDNMTTTLSGSINISDWNRTDWYRLLISAHNGVDDIHEVWHFYLNTTIVPEQPLASPTIGYPVEPFVRDLLNTIIEIIALPIRLLNGIFGLFMGVI